VALDSPFTVRRAVGVVPVPLGGTIRVTVMVWVISDLGVPGEEFPKNVTSAVCTPTARPLVFVAFIVISLNCPFSSEMSDKEGIESQLLALDGLIDELKLFKVDPGLPLFVIVTCSLGLDGLKFENGGRGGVTVICAIGSQAMTKLAVRKEGEESMATIGETVNAFAVGIEERTFPKNVNRFGAVT